MEPRTTDEWSRALHWARLKGVFVEPNEALDQCMHCHEWRMDHVGEEEKCLFMETNFE